MTDEEADGWEWANELSFCGYGCMIIGGPWISTNPDCPHCNKGDDDECEI